MRVDAAPQHLQLDVPFGVDGEDARHGGLCVLVANDYMTPAIGTNPGRASCRRVHMRRSFVMSMKSTARSYSLKGSRLLLLDAGPAQYSSPDGHCSVVGRLLGREGQGARHGSAVYSVDGTLRMGTNALCKVLSKNHSYIATF